MGYTIILGHQKFAGKIYAERGIGISGDSHVNIFNICLQDYSMQRLICHISQN